MSKTQVDMPKVTQMLDAGWVVRIYKGPLGSYEVRAVHPSPARMNTTRQKLIKSMGENREFLKSTGLTAAEAVDDSDYHDGELMTDDFTPEQALTRMAYKVHGQII
jgi:hypothetical protein